MTRNMCTLRLLDSTVGLGIIRVRISFCILPTHIDLRCLGVSGGAGVVQQLPGLLPVSSKIHFYATPVESGH